MSTETPSRFTLTVPAAILIAGAMIAGSIFLVNSPKTASLFKAVPTATEDAPAAKVVDESRLVHEGDPVLGSADAKVTIVEFSDFQCPFCRQFWLETFSQIKKDYIDTGKVRLVYRNYPLSFHSAAKPAALGGLCAQAQGKFWEYHDKLFAEQQKLENDPAVVTTTIAFTAADIKKWASQIGLNAAQFNKCLDSAEYDATVGLDLQEGDEFGVGGTPSFFINGKLVVGAQPYASLKAVIEAALK